MKQNKTASEILDDYRYDFIQLEDHYFEQHQCYPVETSFNFWYHPAVQKIDALVTLWWDIAETLKQRGTK